MPPKVSRPPRKPRIAPLLHGSEGDGTRACHEALKSEPLWSNLRLDGLMPMPDSVADVIELRRCPQCGSSVAKQVPRTSAMQVLHDSFGMVSRSLDALASSVLTSPHRSRGRGDEQG